MCRTATTRRRWPPDTTMNPQAMNPQAMHTQRSAAMSVSENTRLAEHLAALSADERYRFLLDLVQAAAAAVLREIRPGSAEPADPGRPFAELGLDSLGAVALHGRLTADTSLA